MKPTGRRIRSALVACVALSAPAATTVAGELPCGALSAADVAGLGFGQSREGTPSGWRRDVSLESQAAILGREADCLWSTPTGTVELTVGDFDTNVVKGEQVRAQGRVELRSGKLGAGKLSGTGGRAAYDALVGKGSVSVDGTVSAGAERVTLRGSLSFEPPAR